ncbi:MAG: MFS transporter, partial [Dehalococcoidia bacterium]|nr:MFS transporter [Dehalococcoidia bacterium]
MAARLMSLVRGRLYYGWAIVAVGFVSEFIFVSLRAYGGALFFKPMTQEFGWNRATYSGIQSFGFVVDGLVSPFIGPIIDKRGGRVLMIIGALIGGGGMIALGLVQSLWDFYFLRGVVITIGIVCAGPLVINVAISNWFIRRRGKAVAFSLMGVSLGGAALSPVVIYLIGAYGWRWAWVIWGMAVLVILIPLAASFIKRRPEDFGLLPDGDSPIKDRQADGVTRKANRNIPSEAFWTRGQAIRTPALWLSVAAFGFATLGSTALGLHLFPYLTDIGLEDGTAAAIYSTHAVALTISKLFWGGFLDKFHVRHCGMAAFAFLSAATVSLVAVSFRPSVWLVYIAGILLGFGLAGQAPVQEVLWANY